MAIITEIEQNLLIEIDDYLNLISKTLINKVDEVSDISLYRGKAGVALFLAYYASKTNNKNAESKSLQIFDEIFYDLKPDRHSWGFAKGLSGIFWSINHLNENKILGIDGIEILDSLDSHVYNFTMHKFRDGQYDLIHGAVGSTFYLMNRLNHNTNINSFLDKILYKFYHNLEFNKNGLVYYSLVDPINKKIGVDLTTNGGLGGLLALFLNLSKIDRFNSLLLEKIEKICNSYTEFLQTYLQLNKFPIIVHKDDTKYYGSITWCNGYLSVLLSLYKGSVLTKNKSLENLVMCSLTETLDFRMENLDVITGVGICTGTIGLSLIYYQIFNITKNLIFYRKSIYWLKETLKQLRVSENGEVSYTILHEVRKYHNWNHNYSLANGLTGVGLSLMSIINSEETCWQECILLR